MLPCLCKRNFGEKRQHSVFDLLEDAGRHKEKSTDKAKQRQHERVRNRDSHRQGPARSHGGKILQSARKFVKGGCVLIVDRRSEPNPETEYTSFVQDLDGAPKNSNAPLFFACHRTGRQNARLGNVDALPGSAFETLEERPKGEKNLEMPAK